jgi:rubrerythrin
MITPRVPLLCVMATMIPLILLSSAVSQSKYPETIHVLQEVYGREIQAHLTYLAYAQKAISEDSPNIAHLLFALAASEAIHARNFRQILSDAGIEVKERPSPEIKVSTTKENLKNATQAELQEIDHKYPDYLERIKPERHEGTILTLTYAWEAEKQHRTLIEKIQSGTGMFFGMLARTIEKTPHRYFVCQVCGSTMLELPKGPCPICKNSIAEYKEIEKEK